MVNFPTPIPDCDSHSPAFLDLFISSDASILLVILIMLLSQFPLTFHQTQNGMPHFIAKLMTILVLNGTVFMYIWELLHGRISLNSVLLLLLMNFVSRLRLELMYVSLIINIRSSLTYLYVCQLLVLLP